MSFCWQRMKRKRLALSLYLNMTMNVDNFIFCMPGSRTFLRQMYYKVVFSTLETFAIRTGVTGYWRYLYLCKRVKNNPPMSSKLHCVLALLRDFSQKVQSENMICGVQNALSKALLLSQRTSWCRPETISSWTGVYILPFVWQTCEGSI